MLILSDNHIEVIKSGKCTALVEVVHPQPEHTNMCMFDNDLQWSRRPTWCGTTISNKPDGPDDFYKNASYGQAGDYFHIKGVTMLITDVIVRIFDNLDGHQLAAALGLTYDQWHSQDWYLDHENLRCEEDDYVYYYTIKYIDTPPMDDMIRLASACKTIASF